MEPPHMPSHTSKSQREKQFRIALNAHHGDVECMQLYEGVKRYLDEDKSLTLIRDTIGDPFLPANEVQPHKTDGIISYFTEETREEVLALNLPTVCVGIPNNCHDLPKIGQDHYAAGELGKRYFIERGFSHFGFVGSRNLDQSTICMNAFMECEHQAEHSVSSCEIPHSRNRIKRSINIIEKWLLKVPKPIGIMAITDLKGRFVCSAAIKLGFNVPNDVAVLGCKDAPSVWALSDPLLSSILFDLNALGYRAAKMMGDLLRGKELSTEPVLMPPLKINSRSSTDVFVYSDERINDILAFIRRQATSGIHVDDIIAAYPMSRRGLDKLFQRSLGHSPHEEIQIIQLHQVKHLLTTTHLPLETIAERCGISSAKQLIRMFKQRFTTTPAQFRKESQDI